MHSNFFVFLFSVMITSVHSAIKCWVSGLIGLKWRIEFNPVLSTFLSFGVVESSISFMALFPSVTYSQLSSVPRREVINFDLALQTMQFIYTYSALYFILY